MLFAPQRLIYREDPGLGKFIITEGAPNAVETVIDLPLQTAEKGLRSVETIINAVNHAVKGILKGGAHVVSSAKNIIWDDLGGVIRHSTVEFLKGAKSLTYDTFNHLIHGGFLKSAKSLLWYGVGGMLIAAPALGAVRGAKGLANLALDIPYALTVMPFKTAAEILGTGDREDGLTATFKTGLSGVTQLAGSLVPWIDRDSPLYQPSPTPQPTESPTNATWESSGLIRKFLDGDLRLDTKTPPLFTSAAPLSSNEAPPAVSET
ncbi:TPA: hypothetical protein DGH83_00435 [Candidatus Peregrinibacteria bacterium]|nr:hypothetical protein [Candidatus Peregrinibacteria bacterium]